MGEIGKHSLFCSVMLESGFSKPRFFLICWFPWFLSLGSVWGSQKAGVGQKGFTLPCFLILLVSDTSPRLFTQAGMVDSSLQLFVSILRTSFIVPIQWYWHQLGSGPPQRLGPSCMECVFRCPEASVSPGSTLQRQGFHLCGPETFRRSGYSRLLWLLVPLWPSSSRILSDAWQEGML